MKNRHLLKRIAGFILTVALFVSTGSGFAVDNLEASRAKIAPMLMERFSQLEPGRTQLTSIWIEDINYDEIERICMERLGVNREYIDKNPDIDAERVDAYIATKRALAVERYNENNAPFVRRHLDGVEVPFVSRYR
jgi:hypothetical protein